MQEMPLDRKAFYFLGLASFLVQAIYSTEAAWKKISVKIQEKLDSKDGGIESCLFGPPLVGMFIFEGEI